MTPDTHVWSDRLSRTRAARPPHRSMIGGGSGAAEATDDGAGPTAAERARELRASLGVQRDVGAMIAEASEMRARAAGDADALVATAEEVAAKLIEETRREAERILDEAKAEAAAVAARTEEERSRLRAEVEAEVRAEIRRESQQMADLLVRAGDRLRSLTPEVEDSLRVVARALDALPGGSGPEARSKGILVPVGDIGPDPVAEVDDDHDEPRSEGARDDEPVLAAVGPEPRPLGWLFRSQQG